MIPAVAAIATVKTTIARFCFDVFHVFILILVAVGKKLSFSSMSVRYHIEPPDRNPSPDAFTRGDADDPLGGFCRAPYAPLSPAEVRQRLAAFAKLGIINGR